MCVCVCAHSHVTAQPETTWELRQSILIWVKWNRLTRTIDHLSVVRYQAIAANIPPDTTDYRRWRLSNIIMWSHTAHKTKQKKNWLPVEQAPEICVHIQHCQSVKLSTGDVMYVGCRCCWTFRNAKYWILSDFFFVVKANRERLIKTGYKFHFTNDFWMVCHSETSRVLAKTRMIRSNWIAGASNSYACSLTVIENPTLRNRSRLSCDRVNTVNLSAYAEFDWALCVCAR